MWDSDWFVPVRLDHGPRPLGVATIAEARPRRTDVSSTIPGPLAKSLNGRRQLSVAISAVRTRRLADGVLEVTGCQIDEISLCRRGVWQPPLTSCTLTRSPVTRRSGPTSTILFALDCLDAHL